MNGAGGGAERSVGRGVGRHFDGWQPGLLAVFLAGSSAALAVPRPVAPIDLPEPEVEPRALERAARADDALARAVTERRAALEFDVRALGSAIYTYERATLGENDSAVMIERKHVAEAANRARSQGDQALAMLRAYQMTSFLHELRRWETSGVESEELDELGGDFLVNARRNGWIDGGRLMMDDTVRRAVFKKRWNELVQLQPIEQSDERRARLRFLLLHPPRDTAEQFLLEKIDELAALDPGYPADLARGVINFRVHRYPVAVVFFRRYLDAHPEGALTLRAQNYLVAALDRGGP